MRNTSEIKIELVLIRHGETSGNLRKAYIGITDEPLCEKGRMSLLKNVSEKKYPDVDYVFSSPMTRCLETAYVIYKKNPVIIQSFKEINFGTFEGKTYEELKENSDYVRWLQSNGEMSFPKGERKEVFIKRSLNGFNQMLNKILQSVKAAGKNSCSAACVVHGGTIMAVLSSYACGSYYDYQVKNGEGFHCTVKILKTADGIQENNGLVENSRNVNCLEFDPSLRISFEDIRKL